MYLFLKTPSGYMPCYRCYAIILARPHLTHKCCLPYIILPYLTCLKAAHSNRFVQHLCCLPSITFSFALLSLTYCFQGALFPSLFSLNLTVIRIFPTATACHREKERSLQVDLYEKVRHASEVHRCGVCACDRE
jgi:hypothetical protein